MYGNMEMYEDMAFDMDIELDMDMDMYIYM